VQPPDGVAEHPPGWRTSSPVTARPTAACPYKGAASEYWPARICGPAQDGHQDLAWAYDYPARQLGN
jgi:uncharacterized protein (DUF427 family)